MGKELEMEMTTKLGPIRLYAYHDTWRVEVSYG